MLGQDRTCEVRAKPVSPAAPATPPKNQFKPGERRAARPPLPLRPRRRPLHFSQRFRRLLLVDASKICINGVILALR